MESCNEMVDIKDRLQDIDIILDEIKIFPQTYKTILGEHNKNGTFQTILRRKLNNEIRGGRVCRTTIPGTRFGLVIFYILPKKYNILVLGERTGSVIYCFFNYKELSKFHIEIKNYWKLEGCEWKEYNEKVEIFEGHVLKWI